MNAPVATVSLEASAESFRTSLRNRSPAVRNGCTYNVELDAGKPPVGTLSPERDAVTRRSSLARQVTEMASGHHKYLMQCLRYLQRPSNLDALGLNLHDEQTKA